MRIIKGTPKKLIAVFVILLLASFVLMIKGCAGSNSSGGCTENAAPQGYTITAQNPTLGGPHVGVPNCYQPVDFLVKDTKGVAANNICVEIHTGILNTQVAQHTAGSFNCANAAASAASDMTMTSDGSGVVSLEFLVTPTATGQIFFIDVSSGAALPAELLTAATVT